MSIVGNLDDLPVLVIREPGRSPLVIVLHEPLDVGRDSTGILIDDPQASRSHVRLAPLADGVMVTDLGSSNGTFLDGELMSGPARLVPGGRVRVGATSIELLPASMRVPDERDASDKTSISRIADDVGADTLPRPPGLGRDATLTIVFTDIESSTEISSSLGDRLWFELLSEHNDIVRSHVADHDGHEIKAQGDGFMLAFNSTAKALRAMVAAQIDIGRAFAGADPRLRIRVGAHTGEAIADDSGDLYGYHVTLAARIADQAGGGEILVSEILKQIGDTRGEFTFARPRQVHLKGLTGSYNVYPVAWSTS